MMILYFGHSSNTYDSGEVHFLITKARGLEEKIFIFYVYSIGCIDKVMVGQCMFDLIYAKRSVDMWNVM